MQEAATTSRVNAAKAGAAVLPRKVTEGGAAYFEAGAGEDLILIHGVECGWKPGSRRSKSFKDAPCHRGRYAGAWRQ